MVRAGGDDDADGRKIAIQATKRSLGTSELGFSDLIPAIQQEGNMLRIDNAYQILDTQAGRAELAHARDVIQNGHPRRGPIGQRNQNGYCS